MLTAVAADEHTFPVLAPFELPVTGERFSTLSNLTCALTSLAPETPTTVPSLNAVTTVPAVWVDDTSLRCAAPALSAGVYALAVANDGVHFSQPLNVTITMRTSAAVKGGCG